MSSALRRPLPLLSHRSVSRLFAVVGLLSAVPLGAQQPPTQPVRVSPAGTPPCATKATVLTLRLLDARTREPLEAVRVSVAHVVGDRNRALPDAHLLPVDPTVWVVLERSTLSGVLSQQEQATVLVRVHRGTALAAERQFQVARDATGCQFRWVEAPQDWLVP
jgi:hypothetical protein